MSHPLLSLIDWQTHPKWVVDAGDTIIEAGDAAETLFYLQQGVARTSDALIFPQGDIIMLAETLALEAHNQTVHACQPCHLVMIPLTQLKISLSAKNQVAWPMSRSIAADMIQRRVAG